MGLLGFDSSSSKATSSPVAVSGSGTGVGGSSGSGGGAAAGTGIAVSNKGAKASVSQVAKQTAKAQKNLSSAQTALTKAQAAYNQKPTAANQKKLSTEQSKVSSAQSTVNGYTQSIGTTAMTAAASDGASAASGALVGGGGGIGNSNTGGVQTISTETISTPDDVAVADASEIADHALNSSVDEVAANSSLVQNSQTINAGIFNSAIGVVQSLAEDVLGSATDAQTAALAQSAEISEAATSSGSGGGVELQGATPGLTTPTTQSSQNKLLIELAVVAGLVVAIWLAVRKH